MSRRRSDLDINRNAPVQAEADIEIAAPSDLVWKVQADLSSWPRWNPDVKSVVVSGPIVPGTLFEWSAGGLKIVSKLEVVDPPRRLGWTGTALGLRAVHVWHFTPTQAGTRVRTEESFDGLLASVLRAFLRRSLRGALERGVRALRSESERRSS